MGNTWETCGVVEAVAENARQREEQASSTMNYSAGKITETSPNLDKSSYIEC